MFVAIQAMSPAKAAESLNLNSDFQQKAVTGKITDESGTALAGVNVLEKGTTNGAISDANGTFKINVSSPNAVLTFSFIGYVTSEVTVGTSSTVNVTMKESVSTLDEIVVVGYTTQTRKSLTGSVSTVTSDAIQKETTANAITRLQGKAAGVNILNAKAPGGGANITIRGLGTINNNTPLFVIDGVPTKSNMSELNPDEIESLTVLKDASSAAIYGARGANGVILITTKRGAAGKTNVTFNARYGVSGFSRYYDMLNTQEYGEMLWLEAKNMGVAPSNILYGKGEIPSIPDYIVPAGKMEGDALVDPSLYNHTPGTGFNNITKANKEGTDWYAAISQPGVMNEYNLSLAGGGERGTYAFTAGYYTEKGVIKYTQFDRYSIRSNSDAKVTPWLNLGQSLGITYSVGSGNRGEYGEGIPISQAYRMQPIVPVYDIMGNFAGTKATGTGNGENPLAVLYRDRDDRSNNLRGIGNAFAEIRLMDGLRFKSLFGFDYRPYNSKDIFRQNPEFQESKPTDILTLNSGSTTQWNWTNTLNFTRTFASVHTLSVLLGTEAVSVSSWDMNASRSTYFSDDVNYMYLNSGEKDQTNGGGGSQVKWMSYFGRANYDYKERYLLEATVRRDGSSRFGANSRWGIFPAFSAGWRLSEEQFMANTRNIINNLKIRAGWGKSGNDEVGNYNGFSTYGSNSGSSFYSLNGSVSSTIAGFYASNLGNPDARWETTSTTNVGIDVTVLNNTLSATLDVWQRNTKDMLFAIAIPNVAGAASAPSVNIGDMKNNGFDLNINYQNKSASGDFRYAAGLTLSHYKNEIVKISNKETEFINGGDFRQMRYTRATMGTSFPEFFGLIVDGMFATDEEAKAYPAEYGGAYNVAGHFKFRDVNNDGVINDNDRAYIGSPHPKFTAGLNANVDYKGLSLSAFFYSSYGNKIANYVSRWIDYTQFTGNRSKDRLYKSWGSPYLANNADAKLPLADINTISQYPSTAFLEDGSFLRLKTLQLGYTLPADFTRKMNVAKFEIYVQGTNLFTLTKYKGLDPEVSRGGVNLGVDDGQWPTARQFVVGLRLDL
ncbi:MAG TPA: TonB-dependent receptor [Bacteroidales bacterium]|nr:TonB-dependent receptor [Bacteroidales bacterium]